MGIRRIRRTATTKPRQPQGDPREVIPPQQPKKGQPEREVGNRKYMIRWLPKLNPEKENE